MKKKINLSSRIFLINKPFKKKEFYHYLKTPELSLVIPEVMKGKFLIVSQKREPINKVNYEFPSGIIDKNESPKNAAVRELFEETGFKLVEKPKKIFSFYSEPGRLITKNYCFYSNKLIRRRKPEKGIKIHFFTLKEIENLIKKEKFNSASHIAALYYYLKTKGV